ncbi:hypothetical protein ACQP08_18480 [Micromonospora zamorensis]|uniref:hypothetical protein n=1 Tax=Micromonospora zamorensis TaxID=709883 RepID=UPI003D905918
MRWKLGVLPSGRRTVETVLPSAAVVTVTVSPVIRVTVDARPAAAGGRPVGRSGVVGGAADAPAAGGVSPAARVRTAPRAISPDRRRR